jgi:hypothetical protein
VWLVGVFVCGKVLLFSKQHASDWQARKSVSKCLRDLAMVKAVLSIGPRIKTRCSTSNIMSAVHGLAKARSKFKAPPTPNLRRHEQQHQTSYNHPSWLPPLPRTSLSTCDTSQWFPSYHRPTTNIVSSSGHSGRFGHEFLGKATFR